MKIISSPNPTECDDSQEQIGPSGPDCRRIRPPGSIRGTVLLRSSPSGPPDEEDQLPMTDEEILEELKRITEDMNSLVFSLNVIKRDFVSRQQEQRTI